jgi:hypothetical protein
MARRKQQSKDRPRSLIGPFLSPSGAGLLIPRALDPGPPQPEPEERWTLGPRPSSVPLPAAQPAYEALMKRVAGTVHPAGDRKGGEDPG